MEWEYKTVRASAMKWFKEASIDKDALDVDLYEFGKAGWELAAVFNARGADDHCGDTVVIFKRKLS